MNHKDRTYRTTLVYVVIAIASRAHRIDTSSVPGWGALPFMPEHAGNREVKEVRRPHTCSRPCAFEEKKSRKKKTKKSTPPGTHHESRSSPANATTSRRRAKKRPTRSPTLVRFHRCRVCGNRPRTAVAISKNKLFNVTHTYQQTT